MFPAQASFAQQTMFRTSASLAGFLAEGAGELAGVC